MLPVRDSLALEFGSKNINIMNILSMFCLVGVNALYSIIVGKYKRDIFIPYITKFFIGCLVIFWLIFSYAIPINSSQSSLSITEIVCYGGYYLWVKVFFLW